MIKYLLFIFFIWCTTVIAAPMALEFKSSFVFYSANQTATELKFNDHLGVRILKLNSCNKKIVNKFWNDIEKKISTLQLSQTPKGPVPHSSAWVKYQGVKKNILNFEPAMRFFNKLPNEFLYLMIESKTLCSTK